MHAGSIKPGCPGCDVVRRRQAFARWVVGLRSWDLTITLTFDPKKRALRPPGSGTGRLRVSPRVSEERDLRLVDASIGGDVAMGRVRRWLREGEQNLGRRIAAVVCLENHRSGHPHFHGLLGIDGGLQYGDIRILSGLWCERNGYNILERPRVIEGYAAYAAKYMSKDLKQGGVIFWPEHGLLTDRKLHRPPYTGG
jgi:hypothetical protein